MRSKIRKKTFIGVIVSVGSECSIIAADFEIRTKANCLYLEGESSGKRLVVLVSGIGKVNAAHAATRLILDYRPSVIMNLGIGGAYASSGLKIGDVVIAEKEIYGDEGVLLKDGFHGLDLIGIPLLQKSKKKYFNEFALDRHLVEKAVSFASRKGFFLTVSTCTGTRKRAIEIEKTTGAICENMEGAAIAQICALYDVPMIEMRGISNIAEDRNPEKWNIRLASENCQNAATEFIKQL